MRPAANANTHVRKHPLPLHASTTQKEKTERARSSERDTPIEDPKKPQFAPAEADPEQMVPIPVTQFEIFVHHAHRGFAAVLPPVHQATTVNNRPVLRFVYFFRDLHRKAQQVAQMTPQNYLQKIYWPSRISEDFQTPSTDISSDPRKELDVGLLERRHKEVIATSRRACLLRQHSSAAHEIRQQLARSLRKGSEQRQKETSFACEFDHPNVTTSSSKKVLVVIMSHAAAVQPPRKVHLDQIKKFLETSTSTRPSHQQVDLSPAQLPPIARSATPMRTSGNIVASPSQNGPYTRAMPSSASRQPLPPPLVTGTAVNHDDTPYVLRKTRRKPTPPSIVQRQQRASRQHTIQPRSSVAVERATNFAIRDTIETATPSQKDHTLGLGRPDLHFDQRQGSGSIRRKRGELAAEPEEPPKDEEAPKPTSADNPMFSGVDPVMAEYMKKVLATRNEAKNTITPQPVPLSPPKPKEVEVTLADELDLELDRPTAGDDEWW
uniref:Uncharacterized protein n=1 Tax=Caenorhabditis japonica TaxID=281687 RepID=A0A8R1I780_CAEJA